MKKEDLLNEYLHASEGFRAKEMSEDRSLLLLSVLRLICFAAGSAIIVLLAVSHYAGLAILSAFIFLILFLFLLKLFSEHSEKKELAANLSAINKNEADALNGDISHFRPGNQFMDNTHDFSCDIDLFGEASVFQYLNRTVTGYGEDILAGWLSDPYPLAADLSRRQEIIIGLASRKKWRQDFMASGMKIPVDVNHSEDLGRWLNESTEMSPGRKLLIFLLPATTVISAILVAAGILEYSVLTLILLVNLGYVASGLKTTNEVHRLVSGKHDWLVSLNRLMKIFANEDFNSPWLISMKNEISAPGISTAASVKKLGGIIQGFDSRLNLLAGFALNALFLWDYHCIRRLNRWREENRDKFPGWLKIIGEIDAYSSLANFSYNNPDFILPGLSRNGARIDAEALGHPLIPQEKRICNDFLIEEKGRICIITGANMAGKSTFLRTVAVNYILAMTGTTVCASKFLFTPVRLFTSMRTTDSLSGNESYFYAELKRLRTLRSKIMQDEEVFFILDEILKGTNSADKALGSRLFLNKLILQGATGMIATHDISLAELETEHPESVFNMCFEIEIDGSAIRFDYKLLKGITKKMNAAILMRQMGLLD